MDFDAVTVLDHDALGRTDEAVRNRGCGSLKEAVFVFILSEFANFDHAFPDDPRHLVELDVGLLVAPAGTEDVTHLKGVAEGSSLSAVGFFAQLALFQSVNPFVDVFSQLRCGPEDVIEVGS